MDLFLREMGEGPPILCLHGHPGSSDSMAVFGRSLGEKYRVLMPDLRGYGRSTVDSSFVMADHLDDLATLLNQRNINQCIVLGWSLGGIIAMELALRFPNQVTGLILVATAARPRGAHPRTQWHELLFTMIAALLNQAMPGWQWNIDTFARRSLFKYLVRRQEPATYRYMAESAIASTLRTSKYAHQALNTAMRQGYNRVPELAQITQPCWIGAGQYDVHITAASTKETADHLPNADWREYHDVAHLFPWEIPDQLLADINHWLNQNFPV
ncbi:MAG: alpha/beta hydrolase [Cyanobacteria bacterium P01_C01_bin.89]